MRREKIELTDGFGVEVIVCGNAETLTDGRDGVSEEAAGEAVRAASNLICDRLGSFPSIESNFSEWHGGRCYGQRPDLPGRFVVANIYQRNEDGDWDWQGWSKISANMQAEIKAAVDAAEDALIASLNESERLEAASKTTAVYQNNDERLGDCVKFTIAEMTACYRDNNWDVRADGQTMTDSEIEDDILDHEVEFVGAWTAAEIEAAK